MIREYVEKYMKHYKDKEKLKQFKFKQVLYENLISERHKVFQQIFEFIDEKKNNVFNEMLETWIINKNTDKYYTNYFSDDGMIMLNNLLEKPLEELGYK